ncbi:hypothetical protein [Lentilactobacillus hilgardii]|uniref:D-alanyl-D-alanine carboxypeptidase n=1 Tax=Lentilactobacillus hilgardii (strain ATCC 8290 / DSM 20176 / CCUG 30140 / JCM 1155 / KCTC 3500 / NBRC 15886 / NCIMB 8040 / NRRL B-1843 / 9) TaxID=1423757 RepID=C0XI99_LENH9|nr:hypothetical protein [Lentilactobacillus hilgardii]EEI24883.1 hypothetical protein HMPREF0519_0960 [Lentilactobacillus hilgardii DSM 20176 = ATCC 8290]KRK53836.1 D-alanyl-D-alanine carboxypeptidase [Lentilactobacillus hilgardii DSM 20176 = ATCC 8290]QEU39637.1 D-alanyl-D-alanine carboxypeptidase [Lentilactobacillus hilgardii]TDG85177.1 hypothetical protein C5L34_000849 [Lentilactobacillus hilgardii]
MLNKSIKTMSITLIALIIGILTLSIRSQAKLITLSTYHRDSWIAYGINSKTVKSHNAYIWNLQHTKRLHNLNNYKNTTWYAMSAFTRTNTSKGPVYYKVSNGTNITGIVYGKYLSKYYVKPLNSFQTDQQYVNYLKTAQSQKLARGVMRLFPNSSVSLKLSQAALNQYNYGSNSISRNYTDVQSSVYNHAYVLSQWLTKKTATQRVAVFEKTLDSIGYNAEKRASMGDYELGIYIRDNIGIGKPSTQLPIAKTIDDQVALNYQVVLAKEK